MGRWIFGLMALALIGGACTSSDPEIGQPADSTSTSFTAPANTGRVAPASTNPPSAPWPTAEWPVSVPEVQGMDSARLADLVERITADSGIDSVLVVRNGYVVLDAVVYPFPANLGHNMYSVTKSVTGTLVGIAIDRGLLAGVDAAVLDVLADRAPRPSTTARQR